MRDMDIQDPVITMMERYGGPVEEEKDPTCPICGKCCDTFFIDMDGYVFGCENCVKSKDAYE